MTDTSPGAKLDHGSRHRLEGLNSCDRRERTSMADHDDRVWERGWDGHTRAQRARLGHLSRADKIAWLEEAQTVLAHLRGQSPAKHDEEASRRTGPGMRGS